MKPRVHTASRDRAHASTGFIDRCTRSLCVVLFVITLVPGMLSVLKDLKTLGGGR